MTDPKLPIAACPCGPEEASDPSARSIPGVGWRIGIALALAGQGMVFGLGYNNARFAGEAPAFGSVAYLLLHGALAASALLVFALLGFPLLRSVGYHLRRGQVTIELLFLLSLLGAFAASVQATLTGAGSVYYEIVAVVLAIYTIGRQVGAVQRDKVLAAAGQFRQSHAFAMIRRNGERASVRVEELTGDELVEVRPGEFNPVEGEIVEGTGYWRESALTGEPAPVLRQPGSRVSAGTFALDAVFLIRPDPAGGERMIDRVLEAVETARARPSRFQAQADRIVSWFVPLIAVIALGTFLRFTASGHLGWEEALFRSMSVLLVACPCALGLATPIAVWGGLNRFSEWGLVARTGRLIEHLAEADLIFLDKTGTLSLEELGILAFEEEVENGVPLARLKAEIASLEAAVDHPVARALCLLSDVRLKTQSIRLLPGVGVEGEVEGHRMRLLTDAETSAESDTFAIRVERNGRTVARIRLGETLRAGTAEIFEDLAALDLTCEVLTGDPRPTVSLPVAVSAGLDPAGKLERVESAARDGKRVLFIGDGINDAGAMARAHASLAPGHGPDLTTHAAEGVILGESLRALPRAIHLSRELRAKLRSNLYWAISYNLAGITLAVLGWLHPVAAALIMVGSSAFVTARILRTIDRT